MLFQHKNLILPFNSAHKRHVKLSIRNLTLQVLDGGLFLSTAWSKARHRPRAEPAAIPPPPPRAQSLRLSCALENKASGGSRGQQTVSVLIWGPKLQLNACSKRQQSWRGTRKPNNTTKCCLMTVQVPRHHFWSLTFRLFCSSSCTGAAFDSSADWGALSPAQLCRRLPKAPSPVAGALNRPTQVSHAGGCA